MSGQVSRGSAGEYQADEWAGIARTSWRSHSVSLGGDLGPGLHFCGFGAKPHICGLGQDST